MNNNRLDAEDWVTLPRAVLEKLLKLPAEALRIYVYLRSLDRGEPFTAPIPKIKGAVERETRAITRNLGILRRRS